MFDTDTERQGYQPTPPIRLTDLSEQQLRQLFALINDTQEDPAVTMETCPTYILLSDQDKFLRTFFQADGGIYPYFHEDARLINNIWPMMALLHRWRIDYRFSPPPIERNLIRAKIDERLQAAERLRAVMEENNALYGTSVIYYPKVENKVPVWCSVQRTYPGSRNVDISAINGLEEDADEVSIYGLATIEAVPYDPNGSPGSWSVHDINDVKRIVGRLDRLAEKA